MSKTIYIGGRLESKEKGNVVTGANAILDDTKGKKQNVINKETDDELARLESAKQDNLTFDNAPTENSTNPVTSGGVYTAEKALSDAIEAILLLIPSAATELNKLVDINTMNSSISTATATFRGTYNAVSDLGLTYQATHAQIEAALDALGLTADNNDFAFVQIPVSDQSQDIAKTERFKFNGTNWLYEYDLNTSGFTAAQWAAINSGITVALVTKLTDLPTAAALQLALNAKQDTLTFDNEPTALSQNPVTSGGIYTAIQAVATALSDYSTTTDGRLNVLEGLIPTEASSSNKLTDKAYVDGLIQAITELIPAEADTTNQLADKAYVLAQILAATPAFKGQFTTLAELQAVASPKAGDLGIVRTKDSDGMDVFTVYQYLSNAWNVFYSLSYHPQTKPATTGTTGDYPYNGMGRVELAKNMVNTGTDLEPVMVNTLTQDMFYKGAVGSRVPNTNTIFVIQYDFTLGEDITVPANCVLEFDGGSISGSYTLTLANTLLSGNYKITSKCNGAIRNEEIIVDGFIESNDITSFRVHILRNLGGYRIVSFTPNKQYYTDTLTATYSIEHKDGIVFNGNGCTITATSTAGQSEMLGQILNIRFCSNIIIQDIHFEDVIDLTTKTERDGRNALSLGSNENVLVQRCTFSNCCSDGISCSGNINMTIDSVKINGFGRNGITITSGKNMLITNCSIQNPVVSQSVSDAHCSIDIEPNEGDDSVSLQDIVITNCKFKGTNGLGDVNIYPKENMADEVRIEILNNILEGARFYETWSEHTGIKGRVLFQGNTLLNLRGNAMVFATAAATDLITFVKDCYIKNVNIGGSTSGTDRYGIFFKRNTYNIGNVHFDNITFEQETAYQSYIYSLFWYGYANIANVTARNFHYKNISFVQNQDLLIFTIAGSLDNVSLPVNVSEQFPVGTVNASEKYIFTINAATTVDFRKRLWNIFKKTEFIRNTDEFKITNLVDSSVTIYYQKGTYQYQDGDIIHARKAILEHISGSEFLMTIVSGGVTRNDSELFSVD